MDQAVILTTKRKQVGSLQPSSYEQIYEYEPPATEERVRRGTIYTLIEIVNRGGGELDLEKLAQQAYARLIDSYSDEEGGGPLESLETAVTKATDRANDLSHNKTQVHIGACAVWGRSLVYANPFLLPIGIRRDHEFYELDQPPFGTEALKSDDLLLISTTNLYKAIVSQVLRDSGDRDNDDFSEYIGQQVEDETNQSHGVLQTTHVQLHKVPSEEEIIEIQYPEQLVKESRKSLSKNVSLLASPLVHLLSRIVPKKIQQPNIYVESPVNSRKRKVLVVTLLLVVLSASIVGTYLYKRSGDTEREYRSTVTQVKTDLERAAQLAELNPEESLTIIETTTNSLDSVLGVRDEEDPVLTELRAKVDEVSSLIYKEVNVDIQPAQLTADVTEQLFNLTDTGVTNHDGSTVIDRPDEWVNPDSISTYFGNLYILDPQASAIWKYTEAPGGYYGPTNYIQDDSSLTNAIDLTIDGSIYVLLPNRIDKYTVGSRDTFSIRGVVPRFSTSSHIATEPDSPYLYVTIDRGVAVFNKNGAYQRLLVNDSLGTIDHILSTDEGKTLWIQSDGAWWTIQTLE